LKGKFLFLFLIFFSLTLSLFAFGRGEKDDIKTQNDEWILCITSFDVSSLPPGRVYLADVLTRKMVERLTAISYRTRISPEYAYYEEFAWANARAAAARAIASKQDERTQQIFRGDANWRYRQNIARIDTDLERLFAALEEVESNAPLINKEPVFNLTRGNIDLNFPAPPEEGREYRFCTTQRADAFLAGRITEFHGRFVLTVRLYTVYTRSFVWEDRIIFSPDDLDEALDEFTRRLIILLSGNQPAAVTIMAEPEETLVLINKSFAGRGTIENLEIPPGVVIITASAPDYESLTFETTLSPDELTTISLNLNPIRLTDVEVRVDSDGKLYHGALFVGESPMTLRLPLSQLEYIEVETFDDKRGTMVFQTPDRLNGTQSFYMRTSVPLAKGRVDKERRAFYWAWGGTWVTGIAAWLAYYSYSEAHNAITFSYAQNNSVDPGFYDSYLNMYYIHTGTLIAIGAAGVYSVYRIIRYLNTSNKGSIPIKTGRN